MTLAVRLESHAGSVNSRAGRKGGRSPPWESVLIVVCAVFIVIGVRRRSAGHPWAAWTIPALAVQLVAITGLGASSIAGYPLAWAVMLASIALVFVELAVCAWALVARAPAPR